MTIRADLRRAYKQIFDVRGGKVPPWAWDVRPTIPFIGTAYVPGDGLLVYASAENLSGWRSRLPNYLLRETAWDRHRSCYRWWKQGALYPTCRFPYIHLQPINDGGLLIAAALVLGSTGARIPANGDGRSAPAEPAEFLESIAVANFGKFAIQAGKNQDYARDSEKLSESLPYVLADLESLRPRILMLPKKIWEHDEIRSRLRRSLEPNATVIPVPQCGVTVINTHLGKFDESARAMATRHADATWSRWIDSLPPRLRPRFWRYLAAVDAELVGALR